MCNISSTAREGQVCHKQHLLGIGTQAVLLIHRGGQVINESINEFNTVLLDPPNVTGVFSGFGCFWGFWCGFGGAGTHIAVPFMAFLY